MSSEDSAHDIALDGDLGEAVLHVGERASIVLVFNDKRELLLRHAPDAGVPHGGTWTSGVLAAVAAHESYDVAAEHAARDTLDTRSAGLRDIGRAWVDLDTGRAFLAVYVAAYDGEAPVGTRFVALSTILRAVREDDPVLDPVFSRAFKLAHGEDDWF